MTRDDAIRIIRKMLACTDLSVRANLNADMVDACHLAIKALEQEPVLDKIRAEIEDLDFFYDNDYSSSNKDAMFKCNEVLAIFDKYKAESEGL